MHIHVGESEWLDRMKRTRVFTRYAFAMGIPSVCGSLRLEVERMDVVEDLVGDMERAWNKAIQGEGW